MAVVDLDEERVERTGEQRRPLRRLDCLPGGVNAARPCPYVSCRHHLAALDTRARGGSGPQTPPTVAALFLETLPEPPEGEVLAPGEAPSTCVLDVVEAAPGEGGGVSLTLEEVCAALRVSRQRVQQIERVALARLQPHAKRIYAPGRPSSVDLEPTEDESGWQGTSESLTRRINEVLPRLLAALPPVRHLQVGANGERVGQVVGGAITRVGAVSATIPWVRKRERLALQARSVNEVAAQVAWFGEDEGEAESGVFAVAEMVEDDAAGGER